MPDQKRSKPYRVYRGGHVREDDPDAARFAFGPRSRAALADPPRAGNGAAADGAVAAPPPVLPGHQAATAEPGRRRFRIGWKRGILLVLGVVLVVLVVWLYLGYRAFSDEVEQANERLDNRTKNALTDTGSMLGDSQITLVLGSDGRGDDLEATRADSILLVRTDPGKHTISMLSIPRDLRVPVEGVGDAKINAAFALGGGPLLIRTINDFTGLPVNHVAIVNFAGFIDLINAMGGVTIQNPTAVVSSQSFGGKMWRFDKGEITLNGRNALAYSRIRHTTNPEDSDVSRTERQQRVLQAMAGQLVTPGNIFSLRDIGEAVAQPLATDLTANELLAMGWIKFRANRTVRCHLGGTPQFVDGEAVLVSSERNRTAIRAFLGETAPIPQPKGQIFEPGCTVS